MSFKIDINVNSIAKSERVVTKTFDNIQKGAVKVELSLTSVEKAFKSFSTSTKQQTRVLRSLKTALSNQTTILRREVALLGKSTQALKRNTNAKSRNAGVTSKQVAVGNLAANAISRVTSAMLAGAPAILAYGDAWLKASNSIKVFLAEGQSVDAVRKNLVSLSLETRTDLQAQVKLYNRLSLVQGELGVTQGQIVNVIEAVGKAIGVTSTSALEARGSLIQLSQAFSQNIVRAEEINSILEGTPKIANAVATGLGLTTARLRELVKEGKVTSKDFFTGLHSQLGSLREEYALVEVTVSQGMTNVNTGVTAFAGTLLEITGVQPMVAGALNELGKALANFATNLPGINSDLDDFINRRLNRIAFMLNTAGGMSDVFVERLNKRFESLKTPKLFSDETMVDTTDFEGQLAARLTKAQIAQAKVESEIETAMAKEGSSTNRLDDKIMEPLLRELNRVLAEREKIEKLMAREAEVQKEINRLKAINKVADDKEVEAARARIAKADADLKQRTIDNEANKIRLAKEKLDKPITDALKADVKAGVKAQNELNKIRRDELELNAKRLAIMADLEIASKKGIASAITLADDYGIISKKAKTDVDLLIDAHKDLSASEVMIMKNSPWEVYVTGLEDATSKTQVIEGLTVHAFRSMEDALLDFVMTGKMGWEDLARTAVAEITKIIIKQQMLAAITAATSGNWLQKGLGVVSSIFGATGGGGGSVGLGGGGSGLPAGQLGNPYALFSAHGNAFDAGVTKYARGGAFTNSIVNTPTPFTFSNGGSFGEMGEAGPEAILPLTRVGSDLGVKTDGVMKPPIINITVENNESDKVDADVTTKTDNLGNTIIGIVIDAAQRDINGFGRVIKSVANHR